MPDELEDDRPAKRDPLDFEVTDAERRHLKAMLASPGYLVLRKIGAAYIGAVRETAESLSTIDPLSNADKIARRWAYVAMSEEYMQCLAKGVEFELQVLASADRTPTDPADLARRRRIHVAFGALDPPPEV